MIVNILCIIITIIITIFPSALPSVSDLTATSTSNTITLTWTEPDPIPSNGYAATRHCRRLCEGSLHNSVEETSSSSPLVFSDVNPDSYCTISLIGLYGNDIHAFGIMNATTLYAGELWCKAVLSKWNTIILFSSS